jgi:hypothetical protein
MRRGFVLCALVLLVLALFQEVNAVQQQQQQHEYHLNCRLFPSLCRHWQDAQDAGHPDILTVERTGATQRRKHAVKLLNTKSGWDRDEYPPASSKEGGHGASVRYVDPSENRSEGGSRRNLFKSIQDGSLVKYILSWSLHDKTKGCVCHQGACERCRNP